MEGAKPEEKKPDFSASPVPLREVGLRGWASPRRTTVDTHRGHGPLPLPPSHCPLPWQPAKAQVLRTCLPQGHALLTTNVCIILQVSLNLKAENLCETFHSSNDLKGRSSYLRPRLPEEATK